MNYLLQKEEKEGLVVQEMPKQCKTCGRNSEKEYCFQHKPRTPLKQSGMKPLLSNKTVDNNGYTLQRKLFLSIWKKRKHYSEVSGDYLGKEALSTYFHHILPKEKYPQACLDEENIILLTLEEHEQVEMDMYRFEIVNQRRNHLKTKYNL